MIKISKDGIIEMNRGDSAAIPIFINFGTKWCAKQYTLKPTDTMYVSISEPNQDFEHALIRKIYTHLDMRSDGNVYLELKPSDTENVLPGIYFLEVRLKLADNVITTIVPRRKFFIVE